MKSRLRLVFLIGLALAATVHADTLDRIKDKGVLSVGVRNGMRPFGFVDKAKMELVGTTSILRARLQASSGSSSISHRPTRRSSRFCSRGK